MSSLSSAFATTRRRPLAARLLATGCAAAALALAGGCGTAPGSGQHGGGPGGSAGSGQPMASRAVALAAKDAATITSLRMVETMTMHGLPVSKGGGLPGGASDILAHGSFTLHLNATMRLKPKLLAAMNMHITGGGQAVEFGEILTSSAIYVKLPSLPGMPSHPGKPWTKVSLASLPNGQSLRKLFEQAQDGNPLTAMGSPAALAKFLSAAKHLRVLGDQNVGGVPTTEYSGTLDSRTLLAKLPDSERNLIRPGGQLSGGIPFHIWIDHQHHLRKMLMHFHVGKASVAMAARLIAINQPVRITPPPPGQVSTAPAP
jgi:hypothetical protein